jgi:hypothetical protein
MTGQAQEEASAWCESTGLGRGCGTPRSWGAGATVGLGEEVVALRWSDWERDEHLTTPTRVRRKDATYACLQ